MSETVQHIVTDPGGTQHIINGPADATPEEITAQAQRLIPRPGPTNVEREPGALNLSGKDFAPQWPVDPAVKAAADARGQQVHDTVSSLLPLIAGAGAGGAGGAALSRVTGQAPRLLPALGRILGTGAVGGAQTPGDLSDKAVGGAQAAGSAAAVEAALPLLVGGSRMLRGLKGLIAGDSPAGVTNVHVKSAPPVPESPMVQTPDMLRAEAARKAAGLPGTAPSQGVPDPHDPNLNIVDVIRSKYGLALPPKVTVPAAVQTAADAGAGTDTGQNVTTLGGLGLLSQLLQRVGLGGSGRVSTFQNRPGQ